MNRETTRSVKPLAPLDSRSVSDRVGDSPVTRIGLEAASNRYPYDVSLDGKRFLIGYPADAESAKPAAIHVVQNWPALLRGRRP